AELNDWRRRAEGAETELAEIRARYDNESNEWRLSVEGARAAQTELAAVREQLALQLNRANFAEEQVRALENELAAARSELSDLRQTDAQKSEQIARLEHELAQLRADYAALESRSAIVGEASRDEKAEREVAELRARLANRVYALHRAEAELARLRAEVIEARSAVAEMEEELLTETVAAPTQVTPAMDVPATDAAAGDELILINGIGPVFQKRLKEAGITTFAQLAETPEERILEIVQAKKWQAVDASFWKRQAREFAAQKQKGAWSAAATIGDPLTRINGIGPMFERRLKNAGITTFAQLAETSNERIFEIVRAKSWQAVDPEFWRRQAREFVAEQSK
ncbi:MAG: helix-hairpin-helix domain-containing protein, partial [Anaerolineales bacterium]|nr:helix-hairpin-helix domain-containing protein [Anaerolineales bacterium]